MYSKLRNMYLIGFLLLVLFDFMFLRVLNYPGLTVPYIKFIYIMLLEGERVY
jgi:hypothetical protein